MRSFRPQPFHRLTSWAALLLFRKLRLVGLHLFSPPSSDRLRRGRPRYAKPVQRVPLICCHLPLLRPRCFPRRRGSQRSVVQRKRKAARSNSLRVRWPDFATSSRRSGSLVGPAMMRRLDSGKMLHAGRTFGPFPCIGVRIVLATSSLPPPLLRSPNLGKR